MTARLQIRLGALALASLFVAIDAWYLSGWLADPTLFGVDAAIYRAAAAAWLNGADPWAVVLHGWTFAGPPPNLMLSVPFVALSDEATRVIWMIGAAAAALWCVRRLGQPLWWALFPPFFITVIAGNPNTLVLALLLAGAGPLAVFVKVFAAVPLALQRKWRALIVTAALLAVTWPILPWGYFLADLGHVQQIIVSQSDGLSAWGTPLVLPVLVLVVLLGRRGSWLAVPALWPYSKIHYSDLALPACSPWVAAAMAIPLPLAPVAAVLIAALEEQRRSRIVRARVDVAVARAALEPGVALPVVAD